MKSRILALIASLLVCGSGFYAKNAAAPQNSTAPASSAVSLSVASQESASSASDSVAGVSSQAPSSQAPSSQAPSSSCPTTNVSVQKSSSCPGTTASSTLKAASYAASSQQNASCAQNTFCKANSVCSASQKSCAQNSCSPSAGQSCTQGSNCLQVVAGNSGSQSCSDYLNGLLNQLTGKSGNQSSSGSVSSKSASSQAASASASSSGSTATGAYSSFQNQVVQLVNQERTSRGLGALTVDSALTKTATLKSQDMAKLGYFDHTSPTYGSPFDMMKQFGITYRTAGENIAMGQTSPQQVMDGWMNSAGHRANILNSSFTKIGVGVAQNSSGRYYWTQQFIG